MFSYFITILNAKHFLALSLKKYYFNFKNVSSNVFIQLNTVFIESVSLKNKCIK